jgi:hypothetical protein
MAKRRKSGPKRKAGKRTKSGRLSRAYKDPEIRDHGTKEFIEKRAALVNGADPSLAATASGLLLANGFITPAQHAAAQRYGWAHSLAWGRPWMHTSPLGELCATEPTDEMREIGRDRLAKMDRRLTKAERSRVADLAVFEHVPTWFFAKRGNWQKPVPEDEKERQELLAGLDAISDE